MHTFIYIYILSIVLYIKPLWVAHASGDSTRLRIIPLLGRTALFVLLDDVVLHRGLMPYLYTQPILTLFAIATTQHSSFQAIAWGVDHICQTS